MQKLQREFITAVEEWTRVTAIRNELEEFITNFGLLVEIGSQNESLCPKND
jgi:hypothetical protein